MIVLDTNIISELVRARPAPAVVGWLDDQGASGLHLTAVTAAELLYGVARLPEGKRRTAMSVAVEGLLDQDFGGRILPFDVVAAGHYADIVASRDRRGRPISAPDAQIAAICRSHGATLATRNTRDVAGTGIEVIDPWTDASRTRRSGR